MGGTQNMKTKRNLRGRWPAAFTLIELLVVVAIIALLISILLPSLSKARAQARTTLCASRIGQMTKAFLVYAGDYDGGLPFTARGWENCEPVGSGEMAKEWPLGSGKTVGQWAMEEDWLMPDPPTYWLLPQDLWPSTAQLRLGTLFPYTRFETLYRCPEFERVTDTGKSQNVFNYTRNVLARKFFTPMEPEGVSGSIWYSGSELGAPGPMLSVSSIYGPAGLAMLADEQWDYHCAAPVERLGSGESQYGGLIANISGFFMGADPVFSWIGDMIGSYHGPKGKEIKYDTIFESKKGNLAYYDGHVALSRDPLPYRYIGSLNIGQLPDAMFVIGNWMLESLFAQRGLTATHDMVWQIVGGLIN
jgi:prepilin-type N-terminal cleavage/methylation domain-containing protein/prepilin-type processing-associated H-X9-DG protein